MFSFSCSILGVHQLFNIKEYCYAGSNKVHDLDGQPYLTVFLLEDDMNTHQSEGFVLAQCILGNFQYGSVHKVQFFMLSNAFTLKEYEIITLI